MNKVISYSTGTQLFCFSIVPLLEDRGNNQRAMNRGIRVHWPDDQFQLAFNLGCDISCPAYLKAKGTKGDDQFKRIIRFILHQFTSIKCPTIIL